MQMEEQWGIQNSKKADNKVAERIHGVGYLNRFRILSVAQAWFLALVFFCVFAHYNGGSVRLGVVVIGVLAAFLVTTAIMLVCLENKNEQGTEAYDEGDRELAAGQEGEEYSRSDDMAAVVIGTLKLFDRFALIDFEKDSYRYVSGTYPYDMAIPPSGSYSQFVDYICSMLIGEEEKVRVRPLLSKESIIENMRSGKLHLRYECHMDRGTPRWENINLICLESREGIPTKLLVTKQDVTSVKEEQLRHQRALLEACQAAEAANQAKSDFLSKISHDIRTPFNAITGMTTVGMLHAEEPVQVRECLQNITNSSQHMLRLINEVLDVSKYESGKLSLEEEEFSISSFVEQVVAMVEPQKNEKELKVYSSLHGVSHDKVIGDFGRLQQAIVNILVNAAKFSNKKGNISLVVYEMAADETETVKFRFVVEDDGIGMDEETVAHLFEPFYRGKEVRDRKIEGTGLGLAIVRSIVIMMQGDVQVESFSGLGSRFAVTVYLKLPENAAGKNMTDSYTLPYRKFDGKRVLIVDKNKLNLEIAEEMLSTLGVTVDRVCDGEQVIAMMDGHEAYSYDMIFMDIESSEPDGYEIARMLRNSGKENMRTIPIIAMTAYAFENDEAKAEEAGMNESLVKPLDLDKLAKLLGRWL